MAGERKITLGGQVKLDREAKGWTQLELIKALNKSTLRPKNADGTQKEAKESWLIHLENDHLVKPISPPVRKWLAKTLSKDLQDYLSLPMQVEQEDVLRSAYAFTDNAIAIGKSILGELSSSSQVFIDSPSDGPLSASDPEIFSLLFLVISSKEADLFLYSNEKPLHQTLRSVVLFFLVTAILKKTAPQTELKSLEDEAVLEACFKAFEMIGPGSKPEQLLLPQSDFEKITKHLSVFQRVKDEPLETRPNPLTICLILYGSQKMPSKKPMGAFMSYGRRFQWETSPNEIYNYLWRRRELGIVEKWPFSANDVIEQCRRWGITLEIK